MHTSGWGILHISQPAIAAQAAQRRIYSSPAPKRVRCCLRMSFALAIHDKDIVDAFVIRDLSVELAHRKGVSVVALEKRCRQEIALRAGQSRAVARLNR